MTPADPQLEPQPSQAWPHDLHGKKRMPRQPHAGSTMLLLGVLLLGFFLAGGIVVVLGRKLHLIAPGVMSPYGHPRLTIVIEFAAYALTALIAYPILRTFWKRPVSAVLSMNWPAAQRHVPALLGSGLALALVAQLISSRMALPKEMPIDNFFHNSTDVWMMAIFGSLFGPLAEEVIFRGFLLKTFAIAFDWTRQFFGDEERRFWRNTDETSTAAWTAGAIVSSALFAVMHAAQLGWAWNAVAVLSIVGLVFSYVRIRLNSVWAAALFHMGYNALLFLLVFIATQGFRHLDRIKR